MSKRNKKITAGRREPIERSATRRTPEEIVKAVSPAPHEPLTIGVPQYFEVNPWMRAYAAAMGPRTGVEISRQARVRALRAHALRYEGLTYAQVGQCMEGIGGARARQLVMKGQRIINREYAGLSEAVAILMGRRRHQRERWQIRLDEQAQVRLDVAAEERLP